MTHTHDADDDHDHEPLLPIDELVTVRDLVRYATSRFNAAKLHFGHGLSNAYDEAVYLVLHTLHLPIDQLEPFFDACVTRAERETVLAVIERRSTSRVPAAYITQEAWLGDFPFYVDERVIVPRSYCAELLRDGLSPWIADNDAIEHALDLCTGSGCLAILMAHYFPAAQIDAVDLSADALAVATRNVAEYELQDRINLIQSDVFTALPPGTRYDIILSNPPYVTGPAMRALPAEYRHEPAMALGSGEDGLDVVRRILAQAKQHLTENGLLIVEVGHNRHIVEEAFPTLPFVWLSSTTDSETVFLLNAAQLP